MTPPRLTAATLVSALVRRVGQDGGNAVVVARGDATAGAVILSCLDRGIPTGLYERVLDASGRYRWTQVGLPPGPDSGDVQQWIERRRTRDPDIWVVELDVANAQRFAAETSGDD